MTTITQEWLHEHIHYDPITGVFTLKKEWANNYKNMRCVGDVLGQHDKDGYIVFSIKGKRRRTHRVAFLYMTGSCPAVVDHINHKVADNRWTNLRDAGVLNNKNTKMPVTNTSGQVGIAWHCVRKKWQCYISHNNKRRYLGLYTCKFSALAVRKKAELEYNYHPNHGK